MSLEGTCLPPPQEGVVSISSSERLCDQVSILSVLMTVSLPTSFPGTGELSKLDPQTFSDGEILRRCDICCCLVC